MIMFLDYQIMQICNILSYLGISVKDSKFIGALILMCSLITWADKTSKILSLKLTVDLSVAGGLTFAVSHPRPQFLEVKLQQKLSLFEVLPQLSEKYSLKVINHSRKIIKFHFSKYAKMLENTLNNSDPTKKLQWILEFLANNHFPSPSVRPLKNQYSTLEKENKTFLDLVCILKSVKQTNFGGTDQFWNKRRSFERFSQNYNGKSFEVSQEYLKHLGGAVRVITRIINKRPFKIKA